MSWLVFLLGLTEDTLTSQIIVYAQPSGSSVIGNRYDLVAQSQTACMASSHWAMDARLACVVEGTEAALPSVRKCLLGGAGSVQALSPRPMRSLSPFSSWELREVKGPESHC